MDEKNLTPSGDHDEIAEVKEPVSRPYSEAEPHEKADDEVSVSHIPMRYKCGTIDATTSHSYGIERTSD